MTLGGWHRLWVVACAVYAMVVGSVAALTLPEWVGLAEGAIHERLSAESQAILKREGPKIRVDVLGRIVELPAGTDDSTMDRLVNEYDRAGNDALSYARRDHYLLAFAWWLGPCLASYAAGRSIKWVRDGFKTG